MTSPQMARLDEHLQRLRLNTVRERVEALLQEASEKELSYADFLDGLLSEEVSAKTAKHVTMRTNLGALGRPEARDNLVLLGTWPWVSGSRLPTRRRQAGLTRSGICRSTVRRRRCSNQSFGSWGDVFGDLIASAILDRILHHATTISIRGDSYRLKDKLKSGVVKPTTAGA